MRIYSDNHVLTHFCFLMIRRPPRSTLDRSSAASDVYKRQADETERLALSGGALAAETRLALSEFEVGADEQEMVLRVFAAPPGLDAARAALSRRPLGRTAAPGSGWSTAAPARALRLPLFPHPRPGRRG